MCELGLTCALWKLSPEQWRRVLVVDEAWAKMRSLALPLGGRAKLVMQMGRTEAARSVGLES